MTKQDVEGALEAAGIDWAKVDGKGVSVLDSFNLDVRYHDITFEDLAKLSQIFHTRRINIGSEARESGYCETCRYSYTLSVITVLDARL